MLNHSLTGDPRNPAVLFLHGFMGSSRDWKPVSSALGENFYCVAVDLPGHGDSLGLSSESYTMEGSSWALIGLLDELDVERSKVVGYSMGGRLALYFGLCCPERCSGLFLESASPGLSSAEKRAMRRQADEEKARRLESGDFDKFLKNWYRQRIFEPLARDEELLRQTIESRRRNEPGELARSLRGMGTGSQPSLWHELAGSQHPALVLAGKLDEKFVEIGGRMEDCSPKIRFTAVPGAGHNVRVESPEAYLELLQGFLESS